MIGGLPCVQINSAANHWLSDNGQSLPYFPLDVPLCEARWQAGRSLRGFERPGDLDSTLTQRSVILVVDDMG
jgi:hypothetical protein